MNKVTLGVAGVIIAILLLTGVLFVRNTNNQQSSLGPTSVTESDKDKDNLQLQTFSLDELGEPLDESNLPEAVERNEERIDDVDAQIDEDLAFLDELDESLDDVEDGGISQ